MSFFRSFSARFTHDSSSYSRDFPTIVCNSDFFYSKSSVARSGDIEEGHCRENKARRNLVRGERIYAAEGRSRRANYVVLGVIIGLILLFSFINADTKLLFIFF